MLSLQGDVELAAAYKSASQQARVVSEAWVAGNGFCLACDNESLIPTSRNTQARDFLCPACLHPYELKSTNGHFGSRIVDGAYDSFVKRLVTGTAPTLLLLEYTRTWHIEGFSAIHRALLTERDIQRRKPLAPSARRAGWVGCNILLGGIPPEGRIHIVKERRCEPKLIVRQHFRQAEMLLQFPFGQRRWSSALLLQLHKFSKNSFSLDEVYQLVPYFSTLFPNNKHIRAKLRQQLQVLRDAGYIRFLGDGFYNIVTLDNR